MSQNFACISHFRGIQLPLYLSVSAMPFVSLGCCVWFLLILWLQVVARGLIQEMEHDTLGTIRVPGWCLIIHVTMLMHSIYCIVIYFILFHCFMCIYIYHTLSQIICVQGINIFTLVFQKIFLTFIFIGIICLAPAGPAVSYSESSVVTQCPPPTLGQHTDDVLHNVLNYTEKQIQELRQNKVID